MGRPNWRTGPAYRGSGVHPTTPTFPTRLSFGGTGPAPGTPGPAFPTASLIFKDVRSIGLTPSGATNGVNLVGRQQWGDFVPAGVNATYPHGYVLLYPWGEPNNATKTSTPDKPYPFLVLHALTADNPDDATFAAGFGNLANWKCFDMPAICAADPNAAKMVMVGGGRYDPSTNYLYCGVYRAQPIAPDLWAANNSVAIRIDATADLSTAGAYKTYDLVANLGSQGLTSDKLGGQFCVGVAGGRVWWSPTYTKNITNRGASTRVVISVDQENGAGSNYFQDSTHWHWADLTSTLGSTFGGFQGGFTDGRYVWHCQQKTPGGKIWRLDTSGTAGGFTDGTGRADLAANPANWKGIDPTTIHPQANGYLNGNVCKDPLTGLDRWVVFAPFVSSLGYSYTNRIALVYDMTNPAGGDCDNKNNWSYLDTSTVAVPDLNSVACIGYQGVVQTSAGYIVLVASDFNELNATPPYVVWNPLYPFSDRGSWKSYPSYTVAGDPLHTQPVFACGSGVLIRRGNLSTIVPPVWNLYLISNVVRYVVPALTLTDPDNGPGVPPH